MPRAFDSYHHWLGIPPHEQPPNHYRLLSLQLYESDPNVIQHAVDRSMTHLRTFQTGARARESQELLTEISRVRICLLDPDKKKEYDQNLRAQLQQAREAGSGLPSGNGAEPERSVGESIAVRTIRRGLDGYGRQSWRVRLAGIAIAVLLLPILAAAIYHFNASDDGSATVHAGGGGAAAIEQTSPARKSTSPAKKGATDDQAASTGAVGGSNEGKKSPMAGPPEPVDPAGTGSPTASTSKQGKSADNTGSTLTRTQPSPAKPVDPIARKQIENAYGLISDQMAMCQSLKLDDFDVLAQSMGSAGYRPIRVRPYLVEDSVRVGAVWLRDGTPWRLESRASTREITDIANQLSREQFQPVDVAGLDDKNITQYLALFVKTAELTAPARLWFGRPERSVADTATDRPGEEFALRSMQVFVDREGVQRACQIWQNVGRSQAANWFQATGTVRPDCPLFADLDTPFCPTDLVLLASGPTPDAADALTWYSVATRKESPTAVLAGYDLQQHREECRKLIDAGYLMTGLSVTRFGTETVAASLWRFAAKEVPADLPMLVQQSGPLPRISSGAPPSETASSEPIVAKYDVPNAAAIKNASHELESQFESLLAGANNVTGRIVLARQLLDAARSETDIALRYAELTRARELGIKTGHINIALNTATQLGALYKVNHLQLQAEATKKLLGNLKLPAGRRILATAAFDLSEQARLDARFAIAEQLAATAANAARPLHDKRLMRAAGEQKRRIGFARSLALAASAGKQFLVTNPNDPAANLSMGKYVCFVQDDWTNGLALLAKSDDAHLIKLAADDLANPADSRTQMAVADAWYNWAEQQGQEPQLAAWQRAFRWYAQALPELPGNDRKKVNQKLAEIQAKLAPWRCTTTRRLPWVDGPPGVLRSLNAGSTRTSSLSVGQAGRIVIAGLDSGEMVVWDLASGAELSRNSMFFKRRASVALAGDSQIAACSGDGRKMALWNLITGTLSALPQTERIVNVVGAKRRPAYALSLAHADKSNVAGWLAGGRQQRVNCPGSPVAIALSPEGRTLLVATDRPQLIAFDLATGKQSSATMLQEVPLRLEFSADGRYVAVTFAQSIHVLDSLDGMPVFSTSTDHACAALLPGNDRLIIGCHTGQQDIQLEVTDLASGKIVFSGSPIPNVNPRDICQVVALSDPRAVLVGDAGGNVYLVRLPDAPKTAALAALEQ